MSRATLKNKISLALNNPGYLLNYMKQGLRKLSLWDRRFMDGSSFNPLFFNWEVTVRCNLNCEMCWLKDEDVIKPEYIQDELSTQEAKDVINKIVDFKPVINFGGGEPFARDDMEEILSYADEKGLITSVITNGTVLSSRVNDLLETGVNSITVSLDGPEDIHDEIRGDGNFEKSIEVLEELLDKREGNEPLIKINTTVTGTNHDRLTDLYDVVDRLGVDLVRFQHLWFMAEEDAETHKKLMSDLFNLDCSAVHAYVSEPDISIEDLGQEVRKLREKEGIPVIFYPDLNKKELRTYYEEPHTVMKETCQYPWFNAHIKPNGDLLSCFGYVLPYEYGNLKEERFDELWNSKRAKKFRKELKDRNLFPGCKRCCGLFEH